MHPIPERQVFHVGQRQDTPCRNLLLINNMHRGVKHESQNSKHNQQANHSLTPFPDEAIITQR